jgi:hypothetical protein
MAHFAKVRDGIVVQVIVAEPEFFETFIDSSPGEWIQTSYNTTGGVHWNQETAEPSADQSKALRKNYAGVGYSYDKQRDAFIPPKKYNSWVLNEETCQWECPVAAPTPTADERYRWDEPSLSWIVIEE